MTADNSIERVWQIVESNAKHLTDLLLAIPLLRDPNLRATFYPKVEPLLHKADPVEVRRAAITAVSSIPGNDSKTFAILADLMKSGAERDSAISSIQRLPRRSWPKDQAGPLIESLVALSAKRAGGETHGTGSARRISICHGFDVRYCRPIRQVRSGKHCVRLGSAFLSSARFRSRCFMIKR